MQLGKIIHVLIGRLSETGIEPDLIPGFMKSLLNIFKGDPHLAPGQANSRLRYLGWDGIELDYHTLQLAIACFEADGLTQLAEESARWTAGNRRQAA
ncbi:MAG: hypothetical protein V3S89_02445 [Desulfobacterales bacterium]